LTGPDSLIPYIGSMSNGGLLKVLSVPDAKPRSSSSTKSSGERYRRLPTGAHGIDPEEVKRDQRERLQNAIVELIAERGYQAVRILDLTKLARVSRPTFYSLYEDKEELFLAAYDEIAQRTAKTVIEAYEAQDAPIGRLQAAIRSFAELAAAAPEAMSLMVLGAFGAGPKAIERRNHTLQALEHSIRVSRDGASAGARGRAGGKTGGSGTARAQETGEDLTVKVILGGIREVTAARLRQGRVGELPELADELATWAACYPVKLPAGLRAPSPARRGQQGSSDEEGSDRGPDQGSAQAGPTVGNGVGLQAGRTARAGGRAGAQSERALRAEGRLPSGRHDLPRQFIVKNQRERIVDATAAIVAEKGLANLTIPAIARRANVSHQTFYEMYPTKHDAFLGTQKVGLHQALLVTVQAYEDNKDDWPRGVAAGLRALLGYLASEPAHAHLILVDTFAASPEAIEIRDTSIHAFAAYLQPGYHYASKNSVTVPGVVPEAIAGGIWQVLNFYIEDERTDELPDVAPQLIYAALTPFLGPKDAAKVARRGPAS
jgi:AcrR family transcriptional regulator